MPESNAEREVIPVSEESAAIRVLELIRETASESVIGIETDVIGAVPVLVQTAVHVPLELDRNAEIGADHVLDLELTGASAADLRDDTVLPIGCETRIVTGSTSGIRDGLVAVGLDLGLVFRELDPA